MPSKIEHKKINNIEHKLCGDEYKFNIILEIELYNLQNNRLLF